jgi:hypothetical protein
LPRGGNVGIGFAEAVNMIRRVMELRSADASSFGINARLQTFGAGLFGLPLRMRASFHTALTALPVGGKPEALPLYLAGVISRNQTTGSHCAARPR